MDSQQVEYQRSFDKTYIELQREILIEQGQNWYLNIHGWGDKNQTTPICEWDGVTCDQNQTSVIGINLVGYNIAGPISPSLGMLLSLQHINLGKNYLSGEIPKEIGLLPYLVTFKANHNRLSGEIPPFISSNLKELNVSHNSFKGLHYFYDGQINKLNYDDGKLSQLEILDASHNSLVGNIPENLGNLRHLHHLDLSFNQLYGTIPMHIGDLLDLKSLHLNDNRLIGTIPHSFTRSGLSLIDLSLNNNDLSGTIPTGMSNMRSLKNLHLTGNKLTGVVPLPLCHLKLNEDFFADINTDDDLRDGCTSIACPTDYASVSGKHPCVHCGDQGFDWYVGHVGKCLHLNEKILLDSIYEKSNGPMWREGAGWTLSHVDKCAYSGVECNGAGHVIAVNLTDHGLTGTIPEEFGMFRYLESIDLSNNELTGYLPSDFRFLPLQYLDVSGNRLEGVVPPMLCLTLDINGNGDNNDFNCDIISCPAGTWSPIGRATPAVLHNGKPDREHSCQPCKKSHTFLGSRYCSGVILLDGSNRDSNSAWIEMELTEFLLTMGLPLVGAFAMVLCATCIILRRQGKHLAKHPTEDMSGNKGSMPRRTSLRHSGHSLEDKSTKSSHREPIRQSSRVRKSKKCDNPLIGKQLSFCARESERTRTKSQVNAGLSSSLHSLKHVIGKRFSFYGEESEYSHTKRKEHDNLGSSLHTLRNVIGKRLSFYGGEVEKSSRTLDEKSSSRTQDETTESSGRHLNNDWEYDNDDEVDDVDYSHGELVKNFGAQSSDKEDPDGVHSSCLSPVDEEDSYESLDVDRDRKSRRNLKYESGENNSNMSGSLTRSKSNGNKTARASKKAEKWLDVAHPV